MVELGFILPTGDKYLQEANEEGHIEVARRVIEKNSMSDRYERSKWNDPVDFLVFEEGALKIGNRWGAQVITYYPNKLSRKIN